MVKWNPREFDFGDREHISYEEAYNPQKYVDFVRRCPDEIMQKLENPDMTEEEMLDALCWGNFKRYKDEYERILNKRL